MTATDRLSFKDRLTFPTVEALAAAATFIAASVSIILTRLPGVRGISLLWPVCAIAAAVLIRLPRVRWVSAGLLILAAIFCADVLVAHRSAGVGCWFALINLAEIALMVGAFRFVRKYPYPDITVEQAAIMTAVFGIAIPGVGALAGGAAQVVSFGTPFAAAALLWWSSHALGACLFGPPIILFSREGLARLLRRGTFWVTLTALVASAALTALIIAHLKFPFVLMGLPLLIAAFRFGGFGTSVLALSSALTIAVLWSFGIKPVGLERLDPGGALADLPVAAILASVMPAVAVGLGTDARRRLVRALRESERHFRTALEYSPIGILIADLNGKWGYTNLALQKMLGYSAEELQAMPPGGPSSVVDWQESKARWNRLVTGEIDFYDGERRFRHKRGRWVWTHVAVSLMRDAAGRPTQLIAQIESLEERLKAEERLLEEREKLKITLKSISDGVITTDVAGLITYANTAAETLLGLTTEAMTNRHLDEILSLRDAYTSKAAVSLIAKTIMSGNSFQRESPCELHRPDGTVSYITDTVSPVLDQAGRQSGIVVVFRDAAGDVARERELRRSALHDSLTGLFTRAEFHRQLRRAYEKSAHLGRPAAVMAIDLDRFKALNDAAGHAGGDAMLCKVAEALRSAVRSNDTVARLGGDEFGIVLGECSAERASAIGRQLVESLNPIELEWKGCRHSVGASVGIALLSADYRSEKEWLAAADEACYTVKAGGRNGLHIAGAAAPP